MEYTINKTDTAEIKKLLDNRMKYIYDQDMEKILSYYTDELVTFDFKEPLKNKGIDAVKARLDEWFAGYKSAINQEIKGLEVFAADDIAFSHCLTRTYGTGKDESKQDMWYRTTTGYKKIDGRWYIIHEHVSDPVNMKNGKTLFELKPE